LDLFSIFFLDGEVVSMVTKNKRSKISVLGTFLHWV